MFVFPGFMYSFKHVVWYCGESLLHSVHMAFFELVVVLAKLCDAVEITDSFVGKINCP